MSKSETQLTLQDHEKLAKFREMMAEFADEPYRQTEYKIVGFVLKWLEEHSQQALTSLKREMVGLDDITEELSAKYDLVIPQGVHGFRVGVSECQRVITEMMK